MRPKIILADTDTGYLEQLHVRLAESFWDKADFEIITDPMWFRVFLETCREASLLVLSESLYESVSLDRHSFRKTIVLSENITETERISADEYRLCRFRVISELYAEIVALGGLSGISSGRKGTCTAAVCSAAGGDGKTTVSLNLAAALAHNGQRVLYINACRLQTFQRFLEDPSPIADPAFYIQIAGEGDIYPVVKKQIRQESFFYLPPFRGLLSAFGLEYSVYRRIAESAMKAGEYDFIILDTDSAADDTFTSLLKIVDRVILVTDGSEASRYALKQLIGAMTGEETKRFLLVCNDVKEEETDEYMGTVCGLPVRECIEHIEDMDSRKLKDLPAGNGYRRLAIQIS